ncbi:hypothetical protein D9615_005021 [Tricholomella constricta]|uniref:Altered inheritance of mitochondria protein 6 n=1 Tax=Tricholomella constricta TaxID=117010 RepID=A0A8H5HHF1_9AGAR|nr:hypothetical protein D9615_005021 [Tricholomella constricta]
MFAALPVLLPTLLCALVSAGVVSHVDLAKRATCGSTVGIIPLPIHSHNDYTRNVALCDALANSASSVEADVWWKDNKLYVAHTEGEIDTSRTLASLYVQPLLSMLNAQNPGGVKPGVKPKGLFVSSPSTTLQLLIEFKTDGASTFQPVVNALKPLADAGYLSSFSNGVFTESAITVVGTGKTPFNLVKAQSPRTIFIDAPLHLLASSPQYTSDVAPLASTDFGANVDWEGIFSISSEERAKIKLWVGQAHARGIKARFYGTPDWLSAVMKNVWGELLDDGEDWLNVDHLTTARDYYIDWKAGQ